MTVSVLRVSFNCASSQPHLNECELYMYVHVFVYIFELFNLSVSFNSLKWRKLMPLQLCCKCVGMINCPQYCCNRFECTYAHTYTYLYRIHTQLHITPFISILLLKNRHVANDVWIGSIIGNECNTKTQHIYISHTLVYIFPTWLLGNLNFIYIYYTFAK